MKWEGEDLVTDNKDIFRPSNQTPALHFNVSLAKGMGWIKWNEVSKRYQLGPNLQIEFFNETIPMLALCGHDVLDEDECPVFWTVNQTGYLQLSIYCNWCFLNLDKAFEAVVGSSSRSLFVYSDVGGSSVVGNQVTDLLREVNLIRRGAGVQYFEPLHIRYIPVRKEVLDIREVQVSETTGELVRFGEGSILEFIQGICPHLRRLVCKMELHYVLVREET